MHHRVDAVSHEWFAHGFNYLATTSFHSIVDGNAVAESEQVAGKFGRPLVRATTDTFNIAQTNTDGSQ